MCHHNDIFIKTFLLYYITEVEMFHFTGLVWVFVTHFYVLFIINRMHKLYF